jgi:hypothetical protein
VDDSKSLRRLAAEVAAARADGVLPVVLTGNCHSHQTVAWAASIAGEARPCRPSWRAACVLAEMR